MMRYRRWMALMLAMVMLLQPVLAEYKTGNAENGETFTENSNENAGQTGDTESAVENADTERDYISDIRLYKCSSKEIKKTIEKAESEGYIIYTEGERPVDLNEYTEKDCIFLGFKTSKEETEAVRGMKMLEMGHGYDWFDYQKIAEGQMEKIEPLAADIKLAGAEMAENIRKGGKAAILAKDYLNYLYFTKKVDYQNVSVTKEKQVRYPMGDYLTGSDADTQMIKKIIVQANGGSLTALYSYLSIGVSDLEETWAERIEKSETYIESDPSYTQNTMWDRMFYEYALELLPVLKDFAAGYQKAENRKRNHDGQVVTTDIDAEGEELSVDNAEDVMEASGEDSAGDIMYETAYGVLNEFSAGGEKVGDYLLSLAGDTYQKRSDYRKIYPLVEALTDGQYAMMKIVGLPQMALSLIHSSEVFDEMESRKAKTIQNIKTATGGDEALCVWAGVNTEFYEREVAMTSEAIREKNADSIYTDLTRQGEFYDNMNLAFMGVGIAGSVSMLIVSSIQLGLFIGGSSMGVFAACWSIVGTGVFATIGGVIGCIAVACTYITLVAVVVLGIIYFIKSIVDSHKDADKEEYTKMPEEIYDVSQVRVDGKDRREFIRYDVVLNSGGNPQDINADDGKRWNLLYITKNAHYGSPLCLNDLGQAFKRTVESADKPDGYESVSCFGERTAANLNSYTRKENVKAIYLHYITKDREEGTIYAEDGQTSEDAESEGDEKDEEKNPVTGEEITDGALNKGVKVNLEKGEKYLYGLMLSSENSESAAKAGITKNKGYRVYDQNLTPGDGYTYLGYSSTSVKKDAVRDIRIVPNYKGGSVNFGSASYGCAGILPDGAGLMYTKYSSAGSPIIDTLKTSAEQLEMDSIYEPVNMFCGGQAWNISAKSNSPVYLYFKPSIAYVSGDIYIGGLQFVSHMKADETRTAGEVAAEKGLKLVKNWSLATFNPYPSSHKFNLVSGKDIPTFEWTSFATYLCYWETYNPYRAVYDASIYTGTTKLNACPKGCIDWKTNDSLPVTIMNTKGGYAVAESTIVTNRAFYEGYDVAGRCKDGNRWTDLSYAKEEVVYMNRTRAYIDPYCDSRLLRFMELYRLGFYNADGIEQKHEINQYGYNPEGNISFKCSAYRLQGLYQLGVVKGLLPLRPGEVKITGTSSAPEGMHSIQRFTDPQRSGSIEVGLISTNHKAKTRRIWIRGEAKTKGRYISGIDVVAYKRPENTMSHNYSSEELEIYDRQSDDSCIWKLISKMDGEIYNYNIAVDQSKAWYNNPETTARDAAYLGVTRTDDESYAITGLLMYKATDSLPPVRVKADGVEYRRTGDKVGDYYLYYTKNPGANPGTPITDISFNNIPVINGEAAVLGICDVDAKGNVSFDPGFQGYHGYLHLKSPVEDGIVQGVKLVKGTKSQAGLMAIRKGFNYLVGESLNAGTNGEEMYLAYKLCSAEVLGFSPEMFEDASAEFDAKWESGDDDWDFDSEEWDDFDFDFDMDEGEPEVDVVRDLMCQVGTASQDSCVINDVTYHLVSDISLNEGSGGKSIYLYASAENPEGKNLPPINNLCMCSGDAVPSKEDSFDKYGKWEMLLDDHANEVDLNEGVLMKKNIGKSASDGQYLTDCRLFLFLQRYTGGVKKGAGINRGEVKAAFDVGELYVK